MFVKVHIEHTLGNPSDDEDSDEVDALAFHLVDVSDEKKDGLLWCDNDEVAGRFTDLVKCLTSVCFFRSGSITLWHLSLLLGFLLDLLFPLSTSPSLHKTWFSSACKLIMIIIWLTQFPLLFIALSQITLLIRYSIVLYRVPWLYLDKALEYLMSSSYHLPILPRLFNLLDLLETLWRKKSSRRLKSTRF